MHVLEVEAPGGWCDSDGGLRGIGLTRGGEDPTGKPAACGVNELPVAVVELKAQTAGQSVEDAVARFRSGRNPHDRVVAKRMVVWFAADQDVLMTTRLGGGEDGVLAVQRRRQRPRGGRAVRGTRPTLMVLGRRLCREQVWQRDARLELLGPYVHVEKTTAGPPAHWREQWDVMQKMLGQTSGHGSGPLWSQPGPETNGGASFSVMPKQPRESSVCGRAIAVRSASASAWM